MKKLIILIAVFSLFSFVGAFQTKALTTELISETETERVYNILATSPQESSAFQVRLSVSGGTVTKVESADENNLRYIPTCENNTFFDDQNVCADIAVVNEVFSDSQVVLRATIATEPGSEVLFSPDVSHAYLTINGELMRENGEVIETYSTAAPVEEAAPVVEEAKTNDASYLPFVLLLGILVVLVGAFLAIVFLSDKDSRKK